MLKCLTVTKKLCSDILFTFYYWSPRIVCTWCTHKKAHTQTSSALTSIIKCFLLWHFNFVTICQEPTIPNRLFMDELVHNVSPSNDHAKSTICYCTTSSKLVVYKPMGIERAADRLCSFVPFCRSAWCHNNFALRNSVDLHDLIAH